MESEERRFYPRLENLYGEDDYYVCEECHETYTVFRPSPFRVVET